MNLKTLKAKIIILNLLIGLVPLVIASFYSLHIAGIALNKTSDKYIEAESNKFKKTITADWAKAQDAVKLSNQIVDNITKDKVDHAYDLLDQYYNSSDKSNYSAIKDSVKRLKVGNDGYVWVFDSDGLILIHPNIEGKNFNTSDNFKEMITRKVPGKTVSIQHPWNGREKKGYFKFHEGLDLIIVATLYLDNIANYYEDFLKKIQSDAARQKILDTGYLGIFDTSGKCIYYPERKFIGNKQFYENNPIIRKGLDQKSGKYDYEYNGEKRINYLSYVKDLKWVVFVTVPEKETLAYVNELKIKLCILLIISIGLIMVISLLVANSINKPIERIIEGLTEGSDQVASASDEVSSASQSLAEGSSEQAASIEETSSSLEEISTMTKLNADNANQADRLVKDANRVVGEANTSMRELTVSMEEISKANEETQNIVKTIDEIAFQTNLLALNAAVEAARAGEAGAGFAVVADEVRNLAMRAADAAKNTAELIQGTVKRVKDGSELVEKTDAVFTKVAESSTMVGELVGEIAAASREQSKGIEQVNKGVMEMDKVVRQNAANAEESASASEEMNAQAEQMKSIVGELATLIGGNRTTVQHLGFCNAGSRKALKNKFLPVTEKRPMVQNNGIYKGEEVSSQQIISMDDGGFKDF